MTLEEFLKYGIDLNVLSSKKLYMYVILQLNLNDFNRVFELLKDGKLIPVHKFLKILLTVKEKSSQLRSENLLGKK